MSRCVRPWIKPTPEYPFKLYKWLITKYSQKMYHHIKYHKLVFVMPNSRLAYKNTRSTFIHRPNRFIQFFFLMVILCWWTEQPMNESFQNIFWHWSSINMSEWGFFHWHRAAVRTQTGESSSPQYGPISGHASKNRFGVCVRAHIAVQEPNCCSGCAGLESVRCVRVKEVV